MGARSYYALELSRPADGWGMLPELNAHARRASEQMQDEGIPVRFVRSLFVPEDDACFHLYEAASPEQVREAARRASLPFEKLFEAIRGSMDGQIEGETEKPMAR